jgi:hypothetical protein
MGRKAPLFYVQTMKEGIMNTKTPVLLFILFLLISGYSCSGDSVDAGKEITVNISANNTIVVEADTVTLDSLAWKLKEVGVSENTKIRVNPNPVAGAATVEEVQRIIAVVKSSLFDK